MRVCAEVQGRNAIEVSLNGSYSKIVTAGGDVPIVESLCESCGQCVAKCPTGALVPNKFDWPRKEVKTICPYCGVGCALYLSVHGNTVVGVRGDTESPVNKGSHCVKGRFGCDFINHPDRLTTLLIRKNGKFIEATW